MKRIILLLALIISLAGAVNARTFVLAVGVSNYYGYQNDLNQATKDVKAFKQMISSQTKDITVLTSKYANKANILEKLNAICNRAQKGDRIIFYFSGHGGKGGLCACDDYLLYSELEDKFQQSEAQKVCFIDACHSGSVADEKMITNNKNARDLATVSKGNNDEIYFVGCRPDESSYQNDVVGAGYFTQALVKGMRGKSDSNNDKKITVIELFKYIYNDVVKRSKSDQHPQLIAPKSLHDSVLAVWK